MNKYYRILAVLTVLSLAPLSVHASKAEPNQPVSKADCTNGGWRDYSHAGFRNQGECIRFVQTGKFTCRDTLGCVTYGEEDPVRLATALATSGPGVFLGLDELRGVEIALNFHGDLFGHGIELRNEDSMCSAEDGAVAANAIVADPTVAAVVGTSCSPAAFAAVPIISDAGYSMVSPSNTAPLLTDPDAHLPGYMRVAWNDRDQAVAMAGFVKSEGATTSAVIVDDNTYSVALGDAFVETFEALGGTNRVVQIAKADGSDAAEAIAAVVDAGVPDVLYFPVFLQLGYFVATEARATPALDGTQLAASDSLVDQALVDAMGDDAEGMLFVVPDLSFANTPEYADFSAAYFNEFDEDPLTPFSAFAFDATNVILNGIEGVGVIDGNNTLNVGRQALRDALFATSSLDGLTGTITCNSLGDCATTGFVILTVEAGEFVPMP